MSIRLFSLLLVTCFFLSCTPKRTIYNLDESPWVQLPGPQYVFDDGYVKVSFVPQKTRFTYAFRNIGQRDVTISGASIKLAIEDDPVQYAPWGEKHSLNTNIRDIELPPGHFMRLEYPVRVRSPFYPFKPPGKPAWYLEFSATWGFQQLSYRLPFPKDLRLGEAAPEATATSPEALDQ